MGAHISYQRGLDLRAEDTPFTDQAATIPKESRSILCKPVVGHAMASVMESRLLGICMTGITFENA